MSAHDCEFLPGSFVCKKKLCMDVCLIEHNDHHRTHAIVTTQSRPISRRPSMASQISSLLPGCAPSVPTSPSSSSDRMVELAPIPREDCPQQVAVEWDPRSPQQLQAPTSQL